MGLLFPNVSPNFIDLEEQRRGGNLMDTKITPKGYEILKKSTRNRRQILYHVVVGEKILGRPLFESEEMHHVNGIKHDNRSSNLVICPDRAYHMLLHQRENAKKACGHASWRKCNYCKKYDNPLNLKIKKRTVYHSSCANSYNLKRYYERTVEL